MCRRLHIGPHLYINSVLQFGWNDGCRPVIDNWPTHLVFADVSKEFFLHNRFEVIHTVLSHLLLPNKIFAKGFACVLDVPTTLIYVYILAMRYLIRELSVASGNFYFIL
jgi:hypothetical protein